MLFSSRQKHLCIMIRNYCKISQQIINKIKQMNRPEVPGSKPRKFITRTILTNPSLISLSMTSLFDPENHSLPKIYNALQKKQQIIAETQHRIYNQLSPARFARQSSLQQNNKGNNRSSSGRIDSLAEAQCQFMNKKIGQVQHRLQRSPLLVKKELSKQVTYMSRGSSTPSLLPSTFNFKNSSEIRQKQIAGYNIISNLA